MNNQEPLGVYLYMGMGKVGDHTVCLSVAYKLDYAVKKALQFEQALYQFCPKESDVKIFLKVNKVKVGELEAETSYSRSELTKYEEGFWLEQILLN